MTSTPKEISTRPTTTHEHESWCDKDEHAKVAAEGYGPYGCVGSTIEVSGKIMGQAPGGW
ncbi:hypothetical protein [Blastococcus sp. VKM Ac-2987]|uniref:hypothetical protein n=1 Tax=Blastococcus sp. VKM Ac-2987 TaxID=3004141 RepID=UPI0022ABC481|nr:hypothetical protein [Blastococcus sp. VKM Ac-2987]MCZ2857816.1 hypothetical protein [Blastococcus sp. VKM Ac-2987]